MTLLLNASFVEESIVNIDIERNYLHSLSIYSKWSIYLTLSQVPLLPIFQTCFSHTSDQTISYVHHLKRFLPPLISPKSQSAQ